MNRRIDVREEEASAELGLPEPRFKRLQAKDILAIDCLWNRYGYQQGLKASETLKAIYFGGERYKNWLPIAQRQPMPQDQELPFADEHYWDSHNGLWDLGVTTGGQEAVIEKGGRLYSDVNTADEFEVDEEGAALFFGFELDVELVRRLSHGKSTYVNFQEDLFNVR